MTDNLASLFSVVNLANTARVLEFLGFILMARPTYKLSQQLARVNARRNRDPVFESVDIQSAHQQALERTETALQRWNPSTHAQLTTGFMLTTLSLAIQIFSH